MQIAGAAFIIGAIFQASTCCSEGHRFLLFIGENTSKTTAYTKKEFCLCNCFDVICLQCWLAYHWEFCASNVPKIRLDIFKVVAPLSETQYMESRRSFEATESTPAWTGYIK